MSYLPGLVFQIGKATVLSAQGAGTMSIIIQQPYAHLEKELNRAFGREKDVKVITDRRYGERRATEKPTTGERRRADRRTSKETMVEVVLSL
jgi:phosphatidylserine/phosphatidylglycerophosphate/cardiolipin synthase-like enzyme